MRGETERDRQTERAGAKVHSQTLTLYTTHRDMKKELIATLISSEFFFYSQKNISDTVSWRQTSKLLEKACGKKVLD